MTRDERIRTLTAGIVQLPVDSLNIAKATLSAFKRVDHTVNRENLPLRDRVKKFDDAVMGEIATNALVSYLRKNLKVPAISYEDLRIDSSKIHDSGWDVLILPTIKSNGDLGGSARLPIMTISVKSSRIPKRDKDNLESAISNWDFKTLKYKENAALDLPADFWIQIYYPLEESCANALDYPAAKEALASDLLYEKGRCTLLKALRLKDRYAHPAAVALTTSQDILSYVEHCSKKTDHMYVGRERKPIWPSKIAEIGKPLAELASIIGEVQEEPLLDVDYPF
jgi:hypothetical protein